eukprot:335690-Chlamydomonas_euryale.AAC.2
MSSSPPLETHLTRLRTTRSTHTVQLRAAVVIPHLLRGQRRPITHPAPGTRGADHKGVTSRQWGARMCVWGGTQTCTPDVMT